MQHIEFCHFLKPVINTQCYGLHLPVFSFDISCRCNSNIQKIRLKIRSEVCQMVFQCFDRRSVLRSRCHCCTYDEGAESCEARRMLYRIEIYFCSEAVEILSNHSKSIRGLSRLACILFLKITWHSCRYCNLSRCLRCTYDEVCTLFKDTIKVLFWYNLFPCHNVYYFVISIILDLEFY